MQTLVADFKRSSGTSNGLRGPAETTSRNAASIPKISEHRDRSGLERLPPEVRRLMLSTLDLLQLKALVRASPIFHQQYLYDRRYLLCVSLGNTLDSVAVDAYALQQFFSQFKNENRDISGFLVSYSENTARRRLKLKDKLTLSEAASMFALYLSLVKPVTESLVENLVGTLVEKQLEASYQLHSGVMYDFTLSNTELMRFTRAAYRFQFLCQLADSDDKDLRVWREDNVQAFLDILEPWEREELYTFYQFAEETYSQVFDDFRWYRYPENPRIDDQGRSPTADGAYHLDLANRDKYLEGTVLRGLGLLHKVLFEIKDRDALIETVQRHITSSYLPFNTVEGLLGETQQTIRRHEHTSERDRMQDKRAPFPFRGDHRPDAPPLGWTTIWGDTYSNLFGWYTSDSLRQIGYVFWDAERLHEHNGSLIMLLEGLMVDAWDEDPRDTLF